MVKRSFLFDKLVRDKVLERCKARGMQTKYEFLEGEQYIAALKAKLLEEVQEVLAEQEPAEVAKEMADVLEVFTALQQAIGLADEKLAELRQAKNAKRGAFSKGLYMHSISMQADNKFIEYYEKNADRYPEIDIVEQD